MNIMELFSIWNFAWSRLEVPVPKDTDRWNFKELNQSIHRWSWNGRRSEGAIADGGEESESTDIKQSGESGGQQQ